MQTQTRNIFTAVGVSRLDNKLKLRFTNNPDARQSRLKYVGQSAVQLIALPRKMTKLAAAKFFAQKFPTGPKHNAAQHVIDRFESRHSRAVTVNSGRGRRTQTA